MIIHNKFIFFIISVTTFDLMFCVTCAGSEINQAFLKLLETKISGGKIESYNLYDAVSKTLLMASKTNTKVSDIKIAIGPSDPRVLNLSKTMNVDGMKLKDALRYWAELYGHVVKYDYMIVYYLNAKD